MEVRDDFLDELVSTYESKDQFSLFFQKRMPNCCFQIISVAQSLIFTEATPELPVEVKDKLLCMAQANPGFVHARLKADLVAHAVHIEGLQAVLVIFSVVNSPKTPLTYDNADLTLLLIELFFSQRDLVNKTEELAVQKKQFKRVQHILQQRYYKIQDEASSLQLDYAQNLNDEIDSRTQEIRSANERLQRGIDERKRMVDMANKLALKASAANKSKSEFLSRMSHEFRTPLNSIMGFSDLMTETTLDDDQIEYINFIRTSSRSLLDLVNDVLDLSKIESGRQNIDNVAFDLVETLDQVENITRFHRIDKRIKLNKILDSKLDWNVIGDGFRLRQVLVNLIGNAVKFMEKGAITLSMSVEDESDRHMTVWFSVKDEGIGVPEDKVDTIFQPFIQVDGSNTRKYGGTGLGLAISDELVKRMGGEKIFLKTQEGGGSTFSFSLPFPKGSSIREEKTEATCGELLSINAIPCKVLLAEDVLQNRKLVTV